MHLLFWLCYFLLDGIPELILGLDEITPDLTTHSVQAGN
jgi:hypothetical protein